MGDPGAVTTEGNEHRPDDVVGRVLERALPEESEPDLPAPLRRELQRTGYLKIGGHGIGGKARYVSSERVGEVSDDMVRLSVRKRDLGQGRLNPTTSLNGGREHCHAESRRVASGSVRT